MKRKQTIGVDLMGSDNAPQSLLEAVSSLPLPKDLDLLAIGSPEYEGRSHLPFYPAPQAIEMGENPLSALRKKRDSSLSIGMRLLKEKKIDAFVSAGNTGALVLSARMILSTLPSISRPALLALIPTKKKPVAVLDLGANLQVKETHYIQFALLGAAYMISRGHKLPSIGLLNIGSEAMKGTSELRGAYQTLQTLSGQTLRFVGNIEGKSVFDGEVDILVTDGFTGNVFLKTAEGIASLILDRLNTELPSSTREQIGPKLKDLQSYLHYGEYPGALLAGVQGIVIKCHGYSTPKAFANGVKGAIELVTEGFMKKFQHQTSAIFSGKRTFLDLQ